METPTLRRIADPPAPKAQVSPPQKVANNPLPAARAGALKTQNNQTNPPNAKQDHNAINNKCLQRLNPPKPNPSHPRQSANFTTPPEPIRHPVHPFAALPILLILVLAAAIRLTNLDDAPPGIHHDEASNGYDAYCLLKTGSDRWNKPWPLHLEAFGRADHRPALYAYLIIPFEILLGPNRLTLATRLPAAAFGILTIVALYILVSRTHNRQTALLAALLLTLSPWHLQLSRFGHEASLTPAMTVIALALLALARFPFARPTAVRAATVRQRTMSNDLTRHPGAGPTTPPPTHHPPADTLRPLLLAAAAATFALSLYTYASMRLFTPAFLIAVAVVYRRPIAALLRIRPNRRALAASLAVAGLIAAPLVSLLGTHADELLARARQVSLFHRSASLTDALLRAAEQYAAHFSPRWLFLEGDTYPIQSPPGYGQLSLVMAPFLLIGWIAAFRHRRANPTGLLLVAWFGIYPIASAPTFISDDTHTHALRAACGLPVFQWLAALGITATVTYLGTQQWRRIAVIAAVTLAVAANGAFVVRDYFLDWSRDPWVVALYQRDLRDALRAVRPIYRDYDRVYISDQVHKERRWFSGEAYIYPLLVLPVPPRLFHQWPKSVRYEKPTDGFHRVDAFGPFVMTTRSDVLARAFAEHPDRRALIIARPGEIQGGRLIQTLSAPDGAATFEIIAVTPTPSTHAAPRENTTQDFLNSASGVLPILP